MVYIPRKKYPEKPALVVELKWDKSAAGAISQPILRIPQSHRNVPLSSHHN